jgi:hypothetical protein
MNRIQNKILTHDKKEKMVKNKIIKSAIIKLVLYRKKVS